MYRPKGFDAQAISQVAVDFWCENPTEERAKHVSYQLVEAGADAYEEGLKKEGVKCETLDCTVEYQGRVIVPKHSKGYLVFIPDEKEL